MELGQHFLAAFEAKPSKMSSVPVVLKDFITGHIITGAIIAVNWNNQIGVSLGSLGVGPDQPSHIL